MADVQRLARQHLARERRKHQCHLCDVSRGGKFTIDRLLEHDVADDRRFGPKPVSEHSEPERLYSEIGKLKMELNRLKKSQV